MRPQLHPIPDAAGAAPNLEDLGWNDMGDNENDTDDEGEVLSLTPARPNPEAEAEAQEDDREARAQLAAIAADKPAVVRQQEELEVKLGSAKPEKDDDVAMLTKPLAPARPRRKALEQGRRAAFTLRLDAERHLKLRLASTIRNRSAQQIVTEALDKLLNDIPDIEALAAQVKRR
jgi:hypothetical protein